MKIAIITSGYMPVPATKGGAVETLVENIIYAKEKINDKNEIYVFTDYDSKARKKSEKYTKSKFIYIKTPRILEFLDLIIFNFFSKIRKKKKNFSYRYIMKRLFFINKVSKNLKKNNYDKVIIENNASLFSIIKLRKNYIKYKDKYYFHLHNEILQTFGNKELIQGSKKIIGISEYINKTVLEKLEKIDKSKMKILKNCIDIERIDNDEFINDEINEKIKLKSDDIKIVFVGRICEEKGIKELIEAILNINNPKIKLIIVGKSFYKTKVESIFEKELMQITENIKDNILFTGYIEHKEIYSVYKMADIVALPSIWQEPAGLTIIEAAATGVPLITTDAGGITEYVDSNSAIIIKNDENIVKNIEKAINKILSDKNLRKKFYDNAIKIRELYSIEKYYKEFIKILEEKWRK